MPSLLPACGLILRRQEKKKKRDRDSNHTKSIENGILPIKNYVQKHSHNKSYTKRLNPKVNTYLTNSKVKIIPIQKFSLPGTKGIVASALVLGFRVPGCGSGPSLAKEWLSSIEQLQA